MLIDAAFFQLNQTVIDFVTKVSALTQLIGEICLLTRPVKGAEFVATFSSCSRSLALKSS